SGTPGSNTPTATLRSRCSGIDSTAGTRSTLCATSTSVLEQPAVPAIASTPRSPSARGTAVSLTLLTRQYLLVLIVFIPQRRAQERILLLGGGFAKLPCHLVRVVAPLDRRGRFLGAACRLVADRSHLLALLRAATRLLGDGSTFRRTAFRLPTDRARVAEDLVRRSAGSRARNLF